MPSLIDSIDRSSFTAQEISSISRKTAYKPTGPFVRAVLRTQLGDLARDVDASELGPFTLVPQASLSTLAEEGDASTVQKNEVARVEFPGATPLRKPATGKRGGGLDLKEKDPEVYAEAALKYIDQYQVIRPMPRAKQEVVSLLERLGSLRDEVDSLTEALGKNNEAGPSHVPTVKEEERKIQELNLRIKQLRARKDVLLKKRRLADPPKSNTVSADAEEDAFWDEPVEEKKKIRSRQSLILPTSSSNDDSLLLESNMDLANLSIDSIGDIAPSPLPNKQSPVQIPRKIDIKAPASRTIPTPASSTRLEAPRPRLPSADLPPPITVKHLVEDVINSEDKEGGDEDEESFDDEDDDDKTIMLEKPAASSADRPSSPEQRHSVPPSSPPARATATNAAPVTPAQQNPKSSVPPSTGRTPKVRITTDIERIVAKIWSTVGDIIMPGHPFNTAAAATTNKPPRAKETIALLQTLSSQVPSPSSPSTHSTLSLTDHTNSNQPTTQQILTTHLLLTLLMTPSFSLPLNKAKEVLSTKDLGSATPANGINSLALGLGAQALEYRALYTCIAKRLLKIDRTTREQTVKFDVQLQ